MDIKNLQYKTTKKGSVIHGALHSKSELDRGYLVDFGGQTKFTGIYKPGHDCELGQELKFQILDTREAEDTGLIEVGGYKWDALRDLYNNGVVIDVNIDKLVKGGLICSFGNEQVFLPRSQVAVRKKAEFEDLVGSSLEVEFITLDEEGDNIIVGQKKQLEELKKEETLSKHQSLVERLDKYKSDELSGVVTNIKDYGVFITLDDEKDLTGLLHKSSVSHKDVDLNKKFNLGDKVTCKIKRIAKGKIDLTQMYKVNKELKTLSKDKLYMGTVQNYRQGIGSWVKLEGWNTTGLLRETNFDKNGYIADTEPKKEGVLVAVKVQHVDFKKGQFSLTQKDISREDLVL